MRHRKPYSKQLTAGFFCALFLLAHCGGGKEKKADELPQKELDPKYFSKANPGKWEDVASGHHPDVEILNIGNNKKITIRPGFPERSDHYAEVIILADHMHREIGSMVIEKGKPAQATFTLPRDYRSKLYAIIKCNLHDMWEQPIIFD